MNCLLRTILISSSMLTCPCVRAMQPDTLPAPRTLVTTVQTVEVGGSNILDTYLSPRNYTGMELGYGQQWFRQRVDRKWSSSMRVNVNMQYLKANTSDDNRELGALLLFNYMWRHALLHANALKGNWLVDGGMGFTAQAGVLYNMQNGNNPAQARLALQGVADVRVAYQCAALPLSVSWQVQAPLAGLMFSPNYGQSYYEIFVRGNYDHNVVFTWPVNMPSLWNQLLVAYTLHGTTFCVGYQGNYAQYKVNKLKYHHYGNNLVVGIVRHFSLARLKNSKVMVY